MTPDLALQAAHKIAGTISGELIDPITGGELAEIVNQAIDKKLNDLAHFAAHIAKEHGNTEFLAEVERMRKK